MILFQLSHITNLKLSIVKLFQIIEIIIINKKTEMSKSKNATLNFILFYFILLHFNTQVIYEIETMKIYDII